MDRAVIPVTVTKVQDAYTVTMTRLPSPPTATLTYLATLVLLVTACAPNVTTIPDDAALPPHDPRLATIGPVAWSVERRSLTSVTGCTVRYETYEPATLRSPVTVVWTHGFLRTLASMRGWAETTASYGVRAVAVSTCASTPFAGRHAANAEDLRRVADAVTGPTAPVVYAGFSAGGLASLLAADEDPRAVGMLGLDAVDSGDLAATAADLGVPSAFVAGEPHPCNADGTMLAVARTLPGATIVQIPYATHGDFEFPTDPLVDRPCGSLRPEEARTRVRTSIRSIATAWILTFAGVDVPR